jgi:hypothetical protein
MYEQSFPRIQDVVDASLADPNGTPDDFSDDIYSFDSYFTRSESRVSRASLWSMRIGFNYNFF